ncbi:helix-turn-helix domain-containing protein [Paenibacillus nicotianae]|uniref:Helix-turn-helix domain-containing protein n=1 Tax=Paenibacillus nicotianae TaxID=1526551 RepID=A0ABW4UVA5_9BACL
MTMQIDKNIERMLKEKKWTIYKLGKESGVSLSALYALPNKKKGPNAETLVKLADALETTIDNLIRGEGK